MAAGAHKIKKHLEEQIKKHSKKECNIPPELLKVIHSLLCTVNAVTCPHRHGTDIRDRDLNRLCNKQLEVEDVLRKLDLL